MNTKWVIPHMSAMDPNQKRQILANEMVRRLSRVDPTMLDELAPEVINRFNFKLVYSGYPREDRMRIVEVGIGRYLEKHRKFQETGEFYKPAESTLVKRNRDELMSKTTWYKGWRVDSEEREGKDQ